MMSIVIGPVISDQLPSLMSHGSVCSLTIIVFWSGVNEEHEKIHVSCEKATLSVVVESLCGIVSALMVVPISTSSETDHWLLSNIEMRSCYPIVVLYGGVVGNNFFFMDDNARPHRESKNRTHGLTFTSSRLESHWTCMHWKDVWQTVQCLPQHFLSWRLPWTKSGKGYHKNRWTIWSCPCLIAMSVFWQSWVTIHPNEQSMCDTAVKFDMLFILTNMSIATQSRKSSLYLICIIEQLSLTCRLLFWCSYLIKKIKCFFFLSHDIHFEISPNFCEQL